MLPNKKLLRQELKRRRSALSSLQQANHSQQALRHLLNQPRIRSARLIALYWPVRGEISPLQLKTLALPQQRLYLPIVRRLASPLLFVRWTKYTRFQTNRFHIPEPWPRYKQAIAAKSLDIVLMPLVAFDEQGTRLGMGGGFYDRSFAFKQKRRFKRPLLVGFAYQFQRVSQLERASWDIALDAVVTEDGWHRY
ncbi:5-formyltetrahydrofolate cyclo-ligase [Thiolinea disciformis]|uniref:5-formyltetrahydrofolate cyclo-ligase n=1 Tax=Thiolinea disciformis TaxID=125614 RepID=UPI000365D262|nr:5-formyltetrahydrofolate cyclo-ligase [Thiolinea disciformis]